MFTGQSVLWLCLLHVLSRCAAPPCAKPMRQVAEAMEMPELYKTVPELPPEEVSARRKRYR